MIERIIVKIKRDTATRNGLVNLMDKIQNGINDKEPYMNTKWKRLCEVANTEKQKQLSSKKKFLPSLNIPPEFISGNMIKFGKGVSLTLESRLSYQPAKAFIDFGTDNNKFELWCYGKADAIKTPINTIVKRRGITTPKSKASGTGATSTPLSDDMDSKGWQGLSDAVIYWIRVTKNGIHYIYIGCAKLRDGEMYRDGGRRRGHEHVLAKSEIGKLLAKALPDEIDYGVMQELENINSTDAYEVESAHIDRLDKKAQESRGKMVRVNIHNNKKKFPNAISTNINKSNGTQKYNLVHGDIRAAKSRDTRLETKNMSDEYRKKLLDLILSKGMTPSQQASTDWLIKQGLIHKTANRNMLYRWNKEFYGG